MKIKVSISRKSVMGLVEGISLTISQHNGGTPSMQQLWASDAESPKLDIYYREAIGDLERKLTDFLVESSAQSDLPGGSAKTIHSISMLQQAGQSVCRGFLTIRSRTTLCTA